MEDLQYNQTQSERQKQTDALIELLTKRGILPDGKIKDEQLRAARQKRQRDSYHNTLLLLKNYRSIAWMVECFPDAVAEELDQRFETVDELLDGMEIASAFGKKKLESRMDSMKQTRLLVDRINEALTVLKQKPENGEMLYELIYLTYIVPEKTTVQEILYRLNVSPRHYYRLREQAVNLLALRLWSTSDSSMELWIELLSLGKLSK